RPFARTWRGRLFDIIWRIATRPGGRATYWIGTDVARAVKDGPAASARQIRRRRALAGRSACGAPWFVDELATLNISATYLRFPLAPEVPALVPDWPTSFTVSTYVPMVNANLYGVHAIEQLAR